MGAVDPINAIFNYGYALLEAQCWKSLNSVGLDPHVGFLHETNPSKAPLVYDLQEPFRWLVDVAVISALEKADKGDLRPLDMLVAKNVGKALDLYLGASD